MAEPILVSDSVIVPAGAILVRAVRASGPGGQNVNKVSSKVELHVDLAGVEGLTETQRQRLEHLASHRLDRQGRLHVTSQTAREQGRNLREAREKVRSMIAAALVEPKRRRASRPSAGAKERRLQGKKHRAGAKTLRQRVGAE